MTEAQPTSTRFPEPQEGENHIAIWGIEAAGKTAYLAMLLNAFLMPNDNRTKTTTKAGEVTSERIPDWRVGWSPTTHSEAVRNAYEDMVDKGIFPPPTQTGDHSFPVYEFYQRATNQHVFSFTFINGPGEMFRSPEDYNAKYNTGDIYDYLVKCKGTLLLLDPMSQMLGQFQAILRMLERLAHRFNPPFIPIPMAIVITKCDYPNMREAFGSGADDAGRVREVALRIFQPATVGLIENFSTKHRWFASSAIGFKVGQPMNVYRRWDGRIGIRKPGDIQSLNVVSPLVWVAKECGLIAT
jgi:hypothetical protein